MGDIRIAISQMKEPQKIIHETLIGFYQMMKSLEREPDEHRGGKQATMIVMTANDFNYILKKEQIKFADWLNKNNWQNTGDDLWVDGGDGKDFNDYTSEQVYDKYLQTKKQ